MQRSVRRKRQSPLSGPRPLPARPRRGRPRGEAPVAALSRRELVDLVLKLQATDAASRAPEPAAGGPPAAEPVDAPAARTPSLVIETSVRSGQTIEFPGDVTVIGSVGSGAEIVAGGSIHVYGTLRGRAIAGTSGDQTSRIFCRSFQAELLSIDGMFRLTENLDPRLRGRAVQARLDGGKMIVTPLD